MLRLRKKVRPHPASVGPSTLLGLAVFTERPASVRLNTPPVTRPPSTPSGLIQSRTTSWPVQDLKVPVPVVFSKLER